MVSQEHVAIKAAVSAFHSKLTIQPSDVLECLHLQSQHMSDKPAGVCDEQHSVTPTCFFCLLVQLPLALLSSALLGLLPPIQGLSLLLSKTVAAIRLKWARSGQLWPCCCWRSLLSSSATWQVFSSTGCHTSSSRSRLPYNSGTACQIFISRGRSSSSSIHSLMLGCRCHSRSSNTLCLAARLWPGPGS